MFYVNFQSLDYPVVIRLKDLAHGGHSLFGYWKILEYIIGKPSDAGHDDAAQPGAEISGNQLNGVSVSGFDKYKAENEYQVIEKLFSL